MLTKASLSSETLALALEQSVDCVKLLTLDGKLIWMNANGLCAMEIDDFCSIENQPWTSLWSAEAKPLLEQAYVTAKSGETARFNAFCATNKGTPRLWDVSVTQVKDTDGQPAGFISISRDVTDAERGRQALDLSSREIRHRLSNTYAIVSSLIIAFARGTPDREAFAREMQQRLTALHAAQTLSDMRDAPRTLSELIPALVAPLAAGSSKKVTLGDLSDAAISAEQADAIALVLGELTVNSIKHGALGNDGSVHIDTVNDVPAIRVIWQESLGHPVAQKGRDGGQGLSLIRQIVESRDGQLDIAWTDTGLEVTLSFDN